LNQSRGYIAGCGDTGNALAFGGGTTGAVGTSEKYSGFTGSFWVTTGSLQTSKFYAASCGDTGAALCFGGATGATVAVATTDK